jgi:surfactin synthase thioesterase subunit
MRNYASHRKEALANSPAAGSDDSFYAFFGRKDHYRKSGIVSVRSWKKHFGQSFEWYDGTHFTEEEYIYSRVLPCLRNVLNINE